MNKTLSIILLALLAPATATAQPQYVRKRVTPGFFIPFQELNRVEKLPPFPVWEDEYEEEESETLQPAPQRQNAPVVRPASSAAANGAYDLQEPAAIVPDAGDPGDDRFITLEESPLYQQRIEQYEEDLEAISQTGKTPPNADLQKDLQKMDSDEPQAVADNWPE